MSTTKIDYILNSNYTVKNWIDEISQILLELTDEDKLFYSNKIKSKVQIEAQTAWKETNSWGCIYMATGTGKSKIAVGICTSLLYNSYKSQNLIPNILLVVPTEKLRDENWHEEFKKWKSESSYNIMKRSCYASLNKYEGQTFDLVILDEGHNITENNSEFFSKNTVKSCILLTATKPKDPVKIKILKELKLLPVYELSLDESVKLGLVAPYDITVITTTLDTISKIIKGGSKAKPFLQTEKEYYAWLNRVCIAAPNKFNFIRRMRFIYTLPSKQEAAQWILDNLIPRELRRLIFCGSIKQADELSSFQFHSKTDDVQFHQFKKKEINELACVNSLNEGQNIEDLDIAFVVQLNSNELHLVQRIGRLVRYRAGHIGKIIILCVEDTMDKNWVNKSIANLNVANIKWIELSRLKMGIETINFD